MSDTAILSDHVREEIDRWAARFPEGRHRSALIGALHAAQHENEGHLTVEILNGVADYMNLPTIQVYEVATFYSMFHTQPVGRHNVAICTNVSCMLRGADDIVDCCGAQMMMVDHKYYENLTPEMVDEILDGLE